MRPRHMCPGKHDCTLIGQRPIFRFNEAEAHVPRKTAKPSEADNRRQSCFNEAEAHVPRKTLCGWRTCPDTGGFNEAEAHVPRKTI